MASGPITITEGCKILGCRWDFKEVVNSESMQVGKARNWKDVIRILTKGTTDRISADAMLKYFQPLLLWLRLQNRDEEIIGWKSTIEDTALFQPLVSSTSTVTVYNTILLIIVYIGCCIF